MLIECYNDLMNGHFSSGPRAKMVPIITEQVFKKKSNMLVSQLQRSMQETLEYKECYDQCMKNESGNVDKNAPYCKQWWLKLFKVSLNFMLTGSILFFFVWFNTFFATV